MSEYFETLPLIRYDGKLSRDLSRNDKFNNFSLSNPYVFLPYTIKDDDKAEDIAFYYYGSTDYTWLVYLSNNTLDPYHDWPLSEQNFHEYLIQKYKVESGGLEGYDVVDWTRRQDNDNNIVYYYKEVWCQI